MSFNFEINNSNNRNNNNNNSENNLNSKPDNDLSVVNVNNKKPVDVEAAKNVSNIAKQFNKSPNVNVAAPIKKKVTNNSNAPQLHSHVNAEEKDFLMAQQMGAAYEIQHNLSSVMMSKFNLKAKEVDYGNPVESAEEKKLELELGNEINEEPSVERLEMEWLVKEAKKVGYTYVIDAQLFVVDDEEDGDHVSIFSLDEMKEIVRQRGSVREQPAFVEGESEDEKIARQLQEEFDRFDPLRDQAKNQALNRSHGSSEGEYTPSILFSENLETVRHTNAQPAEKQEKSWLTEEAAKIGFRYISDANIFLKEISGEVDIRSEVEMEQIVLKSMFEN